MIVLLAKPISFVLDALTLILPQALFASGKLQETSFSASENPGDFSQHFHLSESASK